MILVTATTLLSSGPRGEPTVLGCSPMEASRAERPGGYLDLSKLSPGEYMGMAAAVVLFLSLFLPWFTTSSSNPNSSLDGGAIAGGDSASAWKVFSTLDLLLVAACSAPFILAWILA